jgi:hypothetical protein
MKGGSGWGGLPFRLWGGGEELGRLGGRQGVKHLSFALRLFYGLAVEMILVGAKH